MRSLKGSLRALVHTLTGIVLWLSSCKPHTRSKLFLGFGRSDDSKEKESAHEVKQYIHFVHIARSLTQVSLSASKPFPLKAFSILTKPSSICGNLSKSCREGFL